jgi:hypothetical protein
MMDPVMLHVFRRRETFSRSRSRPGRSSGSGGCSSACSGLLGPLIVVFVASELRVSRISPYVCPKRISPLPTLIKLRLSPTFPSSSSQKASQPRTARSSIVISYLSFSSLRKTEASDHVVDKNTNTEQRRCPDSLSLRAYTHFRSFFLGLQISV